MFFVKLIISCKSNISNSHNLKIIILSPKIADFCVYKVGYLDCRAVDCCKFIFQTQSIWKHWYSIRRWVRLNNLNQDYANLFIVTSPHVLREWFYSTLNKGSKMEFTQRFHNLPKNISVNSEERFIDLKDI